MFSNIRLIPSAKFSGAKPTDTYRAQLWGSNISQTSDSGFVLCGRSYETCYALRLNANGEPIWDKTYRAYAYGTAHCIKETSDGGFIICGDTYDPRDKPKGYLIKTDADGVSQWNSIYTYDNNPFYSVSELPDGYFIGGSNAIKTDFHGDIVWARSFGTRFNSGFQTSDGGFAFVSGLMRLVKADPNGLAECNVDHLNMQRFNYPYQTINNYSTVVTTMTYMTKPYNATIRSGVSVYPVCGSVLGIAQNQAMYNISVYPNPSSGNLTLAFQGSHAGTCTVSITVRNALGQNVFHREVSMNQPHSETLDLQYLPAGIYFIGIHAEQFNESHKMIIE